MALLERQNIKRQNKKRPPRTSRGELSMTILRQITDDRPGQKNPASDRWRHSIDPVVWKTVAVSDAQNQA
jgi:hypothetical protein